MTSMETEAQIMALLKSQFERHYFLEHPRIFSDIPDAMAVSFNQYMTITGFEIKRKRADWLFELRSKKNSTAIDMSDYWYIVALEGVVKVSDLPSGWGLYEISDGWLKLVIQASQLKPSAMMSRELSAKILHHIATGLPKTEIVDKAFRKGYSKGVEDFVGSRHWKNIGPEKLTAFFRALDQRLHTKSILQLQGTLKTLTDMTDGLKEALSEMEIPKDWETVKTLSPEALAYGERLRENFKKNGSLRSLPSKEFEACIRRHMEDFMRGGHLFDFL